MAVSASGFFLTGGIGLTALDTPFEYYRETLSGYGFYVGAGFEFVKHWNLEVNFLYSRVEDFKLDVETFGIRATLNILAF